jgi:hypothetical protein
MLFGHQSPSRPNLDLQIAQWRLGPGANDPNPWTVDGTVPMSSPRRDPKRLVHKDIMATFGKDDILGHEAVRKELARHHANDASRGVGVEYGGEAMGLFPSPRPDTKSTGGMRGDWRMGDDYAFALDGAPVQQRTRNPFRDSSWRVFDKNGAAGAIGMRDETLFMGDQTPRMGHSQSPMMPGPYSVSPKRERGSTRPEDSSVRATEHAKLLPPLMNESYDYDYPLPR